MERFTRSKTDMRYASPDGIRPNPDLVKRARENFNRKTTPRAPSPSQLPMPSQRLLTRRKSHSKSPTPLVIQGENRKWIIIPQESSGTRTTSGTRTSSGTRTRRKGKRRGKKKKANTK